MSQRLPIPGQDDNTWGNILNGFLDVSHNADGTLADNVVGTNQLQSNAVTNTQLDTPTQTKLAAAATAVQTINGMSPTSGAVTLAASDVGALTEAVADGRYPQSGAYAPLVSGIVPASQLPVSVTGTIRLTTGAPTALASDQAGDGAIDPSTLLLYGPFSGSGTSGTWPTGISLGLGSGTPYTIQAPSSAVQALILKGAVSQSVNLQEWWTSSSSAVAWLSQYGSLNLGGDFEFNGRFYNQSAAGSVAAGAQSSAASFSTVSGAYQSNDVRGEITATALSSGNAAGVICTVTFSTSWGQTPYVTLTEETIAARNCGLYVSARSTTAFTISCALAPSASSSLKFQYFCIA